MREKMLAIAERLHARADEIRAAHSDSTKPWSENPNRAGVAALREVAKAIDAELNPEAPGGEDSGVAPRSTDEPMESVLEPIDWPCRLEDLRPGPAIIVATPREKGRLIFKTEYTNNEKIVAYNEAGEFLCLHKGTIVQAVYLTWREG